MGSRDGGIFLGNRNHVVNIERQDIPCRSSPLLPLAAVPCTALDTVELLAGIKVKSSHLAAEDLTGQSVEGRSGKRPWRKE